MLKTHFLSAAALLCLNFIFAQEKLIDTVYIFDNQLAEISKSQQIYSLSASEIRRNSTNLSETLRFQTPLYIKENGRGAVSSPSFRGTTAQQTAFLWNGIPINSMFLGQGDVNNLSLLTYDNISAKSGGGSVIYGSAAIGGTVHLNNSLEFGRGFRGSLFGEYGSFGTVNSALKTGYSDDRLSVAFSAGISMSENDYEVPEKKYINRNGRYGNQTYDLGAAYRFGNHNKIIWQSQHFAGVQHFPIFEEQQNRSKYDTDSFRSLLAWENTGKRHKNSLNAAFLEEEFSYFPLADQPRESGGQGKTYFFKDDFNYFLGENFGLNFISTAKQERAEGYRSGIGSVVRWSGSAAALFKYNSRKIYLEAGAKKEFIEQINAPFLYSVGGKINVNSFFGIKFSGSKNFRYPSFNDLYWQPGGNLNLRPETSYQAEATPQIFYKNFSLSVTGYYNSITDMIRWLPTSGGFWAPVNTDKVRIQGIESSLNFNKNFGNNFLGGNIGYAYTKSENADTSYQLNYVPLHKAYGTVTYRHNPVEIFVQGIYNGRTFTTTNESKEDDLEPYFVMNAGISATVFKNYKLGFRVANITGTVYETTDYYPLPKRNYSVNFLINF